MKKLCSLLAFMFWATGLVAQERRFTLPEVSVHACKPALIRPISPVDTLQMPDAFHRLSDGLAEVAGIHVRSYGPGQLSTFSLRGTAASHTSIIWKGIAIQSPMLGMSDVSHFQGFDRIELQKGGRALPITSGSLGGVIFLDNWPGHQKDILPQANMAFQYGSFGSFGLQASAKVPIRKGNYVKSTLWHQMACNDFPYMHEEQRYRRQQANTTSKGIRAEWIAELSGQTQINAAWWSQRYEAEIPGSVFQLASRARQEDENHRYALQILHKRSAFIWESGAGGSVDHLLYQDPLSHIHSRNTSFQWVGWTSIASDGAKPWDWKLTASAQSQQAISENLESHPGLTRLVLSPEVGYRLQKWPLRFSLAAQAEGFQNRISKAKREVFLPSFIVQSSALKWAEVSLGLHRKWRIPTLNDLFWLQGGHQNLNPEMAWSAESRILKRSTINTKWSLKSEISLYHTRIEDYIQWLPNGLFWSPQNIGQVWINGLEWSEEIGGPLLRPWHWKIQGQASYCQSEYRGARFPGDEADGKQLIYIPRFQALVKWSVIYRGWRSEISCNHQGIRFTDSGNREWLPAFSLWNSRISYQPGDQLKSNPSFFIECRNLSNASFTLFHGFPQPGRNFHFGMQFQFN